jgi:hypothetical protein
MPKWILKCVKCGGEFEYSQVADVGMSRLDLPSKPDLPRGAVCVCPNCGHSANYKRTEILQDMARKLKYPWQESVQRAIFEANASKKPERIALAETIIYGRLRALIGTTGTSDERQAVEDAIRALQIMQRST